MGRMGWERHGAGDVYSASPLAGFAGDALVALEKRSPSRAGGEGCDGIL
jgi:hypothetical protein